MLISLIVCIDVCALVERYAILLPRLAEHLFGDYHFRSFAAIVLVRFVQTDKRRRAHEAFSTFADKLALLCVRRTKTERVAVATRRFIELRDACKLVGVHVLLISIEETVNVKRQDIVVRVGVGGVCVCELVLHD